MPYCFITNCDRLVEIDKPLCLGSVTLGRFKNDFISEVNQSRPSVVVNWVKMKGGLGLSEIGLHKKWLAPKKDPEKKTNFEVYQPRGLKCAQRSILWQIWCQKFSMV